MFIKTDKPLFLIGGIFLWILLCLPGFLQAATFPLKNFDRPRGVDPGELLPILLNPSIRIIDLRTSFPEYLKGHLPNAVYLHYENLLVPQKGTPAQMPDRICLERLLGEDLGISNTMGIVLYSEKSNPNATFFAWALEYLGHKKIGILNGGWEKWNAEKFPITQEFPSFLPQKYFGKAVGDALVRKSWLRHHLFSKELVIVDARSPNQYIGEEGDAIRRGHIPGAINVFWESTLEGEETKSWKKKEDLEKLFLESGITRSKEIVVYSNTGREASHLYFTLKHILGYSKIHLYRGGWIEWSADKKMPVKVGVEP